MPVPARTLMERTASPYPQDRCDTHGRGRHANQRGGTPCLTSPPRTARRSSTRTGAAVSRSCSTTAGRSAADDWDAQMMFFLQHGYRVVAHDRRGHGRSTQTSDGHDMDTYAADAAAVVESPRPARRRTHRPLDRRRRGRPVRRQAWRGPCGQGGPHRARCRR